MTTLYRSFWTDQNVRPPDAEIVLQVGALCLGEKDGKTKILLVKSSRGRWIIPKGWPMDGITDRDAARIEAWEEAGVRKGKVSKAPLGGYVTEKRFDNGMSVPCHVDVYRIDVKNLVDDYPERDRRERKWFSLKKAGKKLTDPGLCALLRTLKH